MIHDRRVFAGLSSITLALLLCASLHCAGQGGSPGATAITTQSPFLGSVPTGQATSTPVPLSLKDAFDRALKYNLGVIEADEGTRAARAARLHSLNALLPDLTARISSTVQQINLRALGFFLNIPGLRIPYIVGPFGWRTRALTCPRRSSIGLISRT